jgi:hypothetical protein
MSKKIETKKKKNLFFFRVGVSHENKALSSARQ